MFVDLQSLEKLINFEKIKKHCAKKDRPKSKNRCILWFDFGLFLVRNVFENVFDSAIKLVANLVERFHRHLFILA